MAKAGSGRSRAGVRAPRETEGRSAGRAARKASLSPLAKELRKRAPFVAPERAAYLNILRTSSVLGEDVLALLKQHLLSEATFDALRTLRGANDEAGDTDAGGRNCTQIAADMVARVPDITRIVDRLEQAGLATRSRVSADRRLVLVRITPAGRDLLGRLDEPLLKVHKEQLGHMSRAELERLSELLAKARKRQVRTEGRPASERRATKERRAT